MPAWFNQSFLNLLFWLPIFAVAALIKAGQAPAQIKTELNDKLLYYWLQTLLAHWMVLQVYVLIFGSTVLISDYPPLVLVPLR